MHLRRAFGFGETSDFDPFLLLDDFRNDVPEDYLAGFPWHPHRGIETITYVLAGTVEHGDSLGNRGAIGAGDIQWMTAGRGIIHQEMPKGDPTGRMHGFQLWANLPVVAEDDRAALPGGEGGRHPRDHRRRRHARAPGLRALLGQAPGRWRGSPPTRRTSTCRCRRASERRCRSRRRATPLRTCSAGRGPSATRPSRSRCRPRASAGGPTRRRPPRRTTARSCCSTAATRWWCRRGENGDPLPAGLGQAARGARRVVRSDRHEHAGRAPARVRGARAGHVSPARVAQVARTSVD